MVKSRISSHASINRAKTEEMIKNVFGKNLTIRRVTETVDAYGQLSNRTTADTGFIGDLQYGVMLDKKLLEAGFVDKGDAILYTFYGSLTTDPVEEDIIIDGDVDVAGTYGAWEIVEQLEAPELGGAVCHKSFRCKKRDVITLT